MLFLETKFSHLRFSNLPPVPKLYVLMQIQIKILFLIKEKYKSLVVNRNKHQSPLQFFIGVAVILESDSCFGYKFLTESQKFMNFTISLKLLRPSHQLGEESSMFAHNKNAINPKY